MIFLKRDKTIWYDNETGKIIHNGQILKRSDRFMQRLYDAYLGNKEEIVADINEDRSTLPQSYGRLKKLCGDIGNDLCFFTDDKVLAEREGLTWISPNSKQGYSFRLPVFKSDENKIEYFKEIWSQLRKVDIYKYGGQQVYQNQIYMDSIYQIPSIDCLDDNSQSWSIFNSRKSLIMAPNGFGKTTFLKGILLSLIYDYIDDLSPKEKNFYEKLSAFHKIDKGLDLFPIFITAEKINILSQADPLQIIFEALSIFNIDFNTFTELCINASNIVFLVDGLDEVSYVKRKEIEQLLSKMRTLKASIFIVYSSRPALSGNVVPNNIWEIKPLTTNKPEEILPLITNYIKFLQHPSINENAILNRIVENTYLTDLVISPDILIHVIPYLLKDNYETHEIVEATIIRLMRRNENFYINEWDRLIVSLLYEELAKQIIIGKTIETDEVCFSNTVKHLFTSITRDQNEILTMGDIDSYKAQLPEKIFNQGGLLYSQNGKCKFLSVTIMEHLAAKCILKQSIDNYNFSPIKFRNEINAISEEYYLDILELIIVISNNADHYFDNIHDTDQFAKDLWSIIINDNILSDGLCFNLSERIQGKHYGDIFMYQKEQLFNQNQKKK